MDSRALARGTNSTTNARHIPLAQSFRALNLLGGLTSRLRLQTSKLLRNQRCKLMSKSVALGVPAPRVLVNMGAKPGANARMVRYTNVKFSPMAVQSRQLRIHTHNAFVARAPLALEPQFAGCGKASQLFAKLLKAQLLVDPVCDEDLFTSSFLYDRGNALCMNSQV